MKKSSILILIITMFSLSFVHAEDKIKLTVTPDFSVLNGSLHEYVFNRYCRNTDNMVSRLDWDIINIKTAGIETEILFKKNIYTSFYFTMGFPGKTGYMQDYDWQNSISSVWQNDDPTELTDYSIHDNTISNYFSFYCRAGKTFVMPVNITPFAAYEYETFTFNGTDGYGIYKLYNFSESKYYGSVISYKQNYNSIFVGVTADTTAIPHTYLRADIQVSPFLTWLDAYDYHYTRSKGFYDQIYQAFQLKADAAAAFSINRNHSFGLKAAYSFMPVSTGNDYDVALNENKEFPESGSWCETPDKNYKGGSHRSVWTVTAFYRLCF